MKSRSLIILICISMQIGSVRSQAIVSDTARISSMINDWNTSWNTKNYSLAAKWYSIDARFTNAFGHVRIGQKEIESLLKEVFSLPFVMSGKSETVYQNYQVVSKEVILAHTIVERKGQQSADGSPIEKRQTHHLRVFKNDGKGWLIVSHLISDSRDRERAQH